LTRATPESTLEGRSTHQGGRVLARVSKKQIVAALLDRHGQTYAEELGIDPRKQTPSNLFQLLCAAVLFSARIDASIATEAARNLKRRGWRTAGKLADSTWRQRVAALNDAGYTRYQERTATMLGEMAETVLERWGGDLRRLREEAGRDPKRERKLLKQFKGMGDVGVDIFFREAQAGWDELRPFADRRALDAARRLDLGRDAKALARLADGHDFDRLVAALVRTELSDDYDEIRAAARG
jgi:endonuclease III